MSEVGCIIGKIIRISLENCFRRLFLIGNARLVNFVAFLWSTGTWGLLGLLLWRQLKHLCWAECLMSSLKFNQVLLFDAVNLCFSALDSQFLRFSSIRWRNWKRQCLSFEVYRSFQHFSNIKCGKVYDSRRHSSYDAQCDHREALSMTTTNGKSWWSLSSRNCWNRKHIFRWTEIT